MGVWIASFLISAFVLSYFPIVFQVKWPRAFQGCNNCQMNAWKASLILSLHIQSLPTAESS